MDSALSKLVPGQSFLVGDSPTDLQGVQGYKAGMTTAAPQPRKPRKPTATKPTAKAGTKSSSKSTAKPKAKSSLAASNEQPEESASQLIDQRIRELGGWRGQTLARMRALILEANPQVIEEWKWMGTPVWSHHGILCTGEAYAKVVKLTFAHGASIPDPARLFNSSLEGNMRRAIDIHEGETVDADAFKELIRAAGARNDQQPRKAHR